MPSRPSRLASIAALAAGAVLTGSLAALAAGTGTIDPPPRIAFVARSDNPADALAVGPTAGQLGAPVFVTAPGSLVPSTQAGLGAYAPELVIIAGGDAAIAPSVEQSIETALGLPDDQVVRAAGTDRHETAVKISELLAAYDPAFLPVDATATDSDLLDGMDSTDFLAANGSTAITAPSFTYASPVERTAVVTYASFVSTDSEMDITATGVHAETFNTQLFAPVDLPDGATVTAFTCTVYDNIAPRDLNCTLLRTPLDSTIAATVAGAPVSGDGGAITGTDTTISGDGAVDNSEYGWFVRVRPTDGTWNHVGVFSAEVTYVVDTPLP